MYVGRILGFAGPSQLIFTHAIFVLDVRGAKEGVHLCSAGQIVRKIVVAWGLTVYQACGGKWLGVPRQNMCGLCAMP